MKRVVGILNEGHGLKPIISKVINTNIAILASDETVYFYDIQKNKVITKIICNSLIFDVINNKQNEKRIFIVCELGIRCITSEGDTVWIYNSHDILENFIFYSDYVIVTFDNINYKISLVDGNVLHI